MIRNARGMEFETLCTLLVLEYIVISVLRRYMIL